MDYPVPVPLGFVFPVDFCATGAILLGISVRAFKIQVEMALHFSIWVIAFTPNGFFCSIYHLLLRYLVGFRFIISISF